jgi:hypothetical protein
MCYMDVNLPVPAVLDIEASGFGRRSYPIEVGCILPDGKTFCTLIRPEPEWVHWDPEAEKLHHISRTLTETVGRSALDVAQLLNLHLRGQTVYSDGWANDFTWIGALFEAVDMSPYFKLENLRSLLSDDEAARWHDMKQQVAEELGGQRHRASSDARVLQCTLQRLIEQRQ